MSLALVGDIIICILFLNLVRFANDVVGWKGRRPNGSLGIYFNFAYWPRENEQVGIFARELFLFPLKRLFFS